MKAVARGALRGALIGTAVMCAALALAALSADDIPAAAWWILAAVGFGSGSVVAS